PVHTADVDVDLRIAEVGIASREVDRGSVRQRAGIEVLGQVNRADTVVVVVVVVARLGKAHESVSGSAGLEVRRLAPARPATRAAAEASVIVGSKPGRQRGNRRL